MRKTRNILRDCRITARYKGYYYLPEAVQILRRNETKHLRITNDIYPVIAEKYCTTIDCVEHDIRTVIEKCWNNNKEFVRDIIGYEALRCPSNREFIDCVAYYTEKRE